MTNENENSGICPIHQCPLPACPADCPNNPKIIPNREEVLKYFGENSAEKEHCFTKEEVVGEIRKFSQTKGVESHDFQSEPEKEEYDKEGNLVYLSLPVTPDYARKKGEGSISYIFLAKGKHQAGESTATTVMIIYGSVEKPDEVYFSNVVLEFTKNEWKKS